MSTKTSETTEGPLAAAAPAPRGGGAGEEAPPGSLPPLKAGEFFLGYLDEGGSRPPMPQPETLSRNGSYLAYLRFQEHVGAFRDFLRQQGQTRDEQELGDRAVGGRCVLEHLSGICDRLGAQFNLEPNG